MKQTSIDLSGFSATKTSYFKNCSFFQEYKITNGSSKLEIKLETKNPFLELDYVSQAQGTFNNNLFAKEHCSMLSELLGTSQENVLNKAIRRIPDQTWKLATRKLVYLLNKTEKEEFALAALAKEVQPIPMDKYQKQRD